MSEDEALILLAGGLPQLQVETQGVELDKLAARLGKWALLLRLVGRFLNERVIRNRQPLDQAIAGVNKRLDEKGLRAFDARNETDRAKAVARTIGVGMEFLDEAGRIRFLELAVFPEDINIPIGIATRFWAQTGLNELDAEDILAELYDLSLLVDLELESRTFRLHDTVRHFLKDQFNDGKIVSLHTRLLNAITNIDMGDEADELTLNYYYQHRLYHLTEAKNYEARKALLADPLWLMKKLDALRSPQALVADFEKYSESSAHYVIGATLRLVAGILARDCRQLLPQLIGRIAPRDAPSVGIFLKSARNLIVAPALVPTTATLTRARAEVSRLEGHKGESIPEEGGIFAMISLPNGLLASAGDETDIRIWDLATESQISQICGHTSWVYSLAALPNGLLASASDDHTVRIWNPTTRAELFRLDGHNAPVYHVVTLPNGRLASAGDDAIRIWDTISKSLSGKFMLDCRVF